MTSSDMNEIFLHWLKGHFLRAPVYFGTLF